MNYLLNICLLISIFMPFASLNRLGLGYRLNLCLASCYAALHCFAYFSVSESNFSMSASECAVLKAPV